MSIVAVALSKENTMSQKQVRTPSGGKAPSGSASGNKGGKPAGTKGSKGK